MIPVTLLSQNGFMMGQGIPFSLTNLTFIFEERLLKQEGIYINNRMKIIKAVLSTF